MAAERQSYNGLMHAGGGTVLFLLPLSAMIPGLVPFIALAGVFTAVLVIPMLVLGLVAALLATPPLGIWLLVRRIRAGRAESRRAATAAPASTAHRPRPLPPREDPLVTRIPVTTAIPEELAIAADTVSRE